MARNTYFARIENDFTELSASQRKLLSEISAALREGGYTVVQLRKQLRGITTRQAKKVPNAYAKYVKQNWKRVAAANPDAKFVDVSRIISHEWKASQATDSDQVDDESEKDTQPVETVAEAVAEPVAEAMQE